MPVLTFSSPLMSSLHPASPSLWVLIWVCAFLDSVGAAEVKAGAGGEEEEGGGGQGGPGLEVSGKSGALIDPLSWGRECDDDENSKSS